MPSRATDPTKINWSNWLESVSMNPNAVVDEADIVMSSRVITSGLLPVLKLPTKSCQRTMHQNRKNVECGGFLYRPRRFGPKPQRPRFSHSDRYKDVGVVNSRSVDTFTFPNNGAISRSKLCFAAVITKSNGIATSTKRIDPTTQGFL